MTMWSRSPALPFLHATLLTILYCTGACNILFIIKFVEERAREFLFPCSLTSCGPSDLFLLSLICLSITALYLTIKQCICQVGMCEYSRQSSAISILLGVKIISVTLGRNKVSPYVIQRTFHESWLVKWLKLSCKYSYLYQRKMFFIFVEKFVWSLFWKTWRKGLLLRHI